MIEMENKIIAYINGSLTSEETTTLLGQIENSKELKELLLAYQSIESDFENNIEELPSNRLSNNFQDHLAALQEKNKNTNSSAKVFSIKPYIKYAAACVVLLIAGTAIWNQIDQKDNSEQMAINAILSDMETKSDTDKIKALYVNNDSTEKNQFKIKQVLIESLKNDESSNVRLASVETLMDYIEDDIVRSALIRSLGVEEDPQVQVAIIMALSKSKNIEVIKPLEEIINKEGGYKFVKDEAHVGIMNLTSI